MKRALVIVAAVGVGVVVARNHSMSSGQKVPAETAASPAAAEAAAAQLSGAAPLAVTEKIGADLVSHHSPGECRQAATNLAAISMAIMWFALCVMYSIRPITVAI